MRYEMNLLVTGAFAWTDDELNNLRLLGHEVIFMQQENNPLPCDASWIEGIIGNGIFLNHSIEQFTSLKYIQLTSAGFDRIPMDYVKAHNIEIHNARGVYSIPMAEFAVCGVLQLYKQSGFFHDNQKKHSWVKHRGLVELHDKNVCIVGCGSVGNECAKLFRGFGCHVSGIDISPYKNALYEKISFLTDIDDELKKSDITVLSLPLIEDTKKLMNIDRISMMKPDSILVNIARGGIIDTDVMISALNSHLRGAVLDVFEDEPLPADSPLWDMQNVIITPHNSFVGDGNHERMWNVITKNLRGAAQ